jgi:CubicO group peptidase (beta-lactamase class C family)
MRILCVLVMALVVTRDGLAQDATRLEQVVQTAVANRTFSGAVLVARGSTVVLSKGYGLANREWDIPNLPATRFRLGSLTKQFTAAAVLLLEERGKLSVDDPIAKHLPNAPAAWAPITIRHLLSHSSGIPNFTAMPEYPSLRPFATTAAKTVAVFKDKPLDFAPGEKMAYSNSGYLVLGLLIETLSGQSYEAFVRDNLFAPLGMKDSGVDANAAIIPRRAAGYAPSPAGPVNAGFIDMTIPHAAGALYSTTEDLLRWEQALFSSKVVSASSLQKMTTPFKNDYAFGLVVRSSKGRKVVEHSGGIEGFNTAMAFYPETQTAVIVLANLNGPTADQLSASLGAVAHGETVTPPSERTAISLPASALAKYVGQYEMAPGIVLTVSANGEQLMAQLTGQGPNAIFPESERRFFLKVVDAQLEFFVDASGTVTHLVLYQNGREMKGLRR